MRWIGILDGNAVVNDKVGFEVVEFIQIALEHISLS